jgi:anti-sigma B factor antagonist
MVSIGMGQKISVEITSEEKAAVVSFKAASISDVGGITAATKQIKEFIERNRPNAVVFDFERVKFFSSQVLGMLLDIRAKLETYNGEVVISAINPQLHRIFKVTNLDKIFRFFPDRKNAVKAVSAN